MEPLVERLEQRRGLRGRQLDPKESRRRRCEAEGQRLECRWALLRIPLPPAWAWACSSESHRPSVRAQPWVPQPEPYQPSAPRPPPLTHPRLRPPISRSVRRLSRRRCLRRRSAGGAGENGELPRRGAGREGYVRGEGGEKDDPDGIRTRVAALKGPCPRPLDDRAVSRDDKRRGTGIVVTPAGQRQGARRPTNPPPSAGI